MHQLFLRATLVLSLLLLSFNLFAQLPTTVFTDSLASQSLGETRQLKIQVPHSPDPDKRFPVVVLLDGESLFDQLKTVQQNYQGGFLPDMVMVSVINGNNRTLNFTPSKVTERNGAPYTEASGGAAAFRSFIKDELLPYLKQNYPASDYRILIGHSYAGLFAIDTLLEDPELFNNYLAIDPSLDWDEQVVVKKAATQLKTLEGKGLFVSIGGVLHMQDPSITLDNVMEDSTDYTAFARANLTFRNLAGGTPGADRFMWNFYEDELHGTIPLQSMIHGLKHLFEWYRIENVTLFNDPATPTATLVKLVEDRAAKLERELGYVEPPFEEELLTMLGYMNTSWGNLQTAKAFFDFGVKYYPNSANSWDSLAEYYEGQAAWQKAYDAQSKAVALDGDDYFTKRLDAIKAKM